MRPTIGRIVHYRLSHEDVQRVEDTRRRLATAGLESGNVAADGDVVPLIVVRVWPNEFGYGLDGINGQAFLDGHAQLWVTSAREGTEPGQWVLAGASVGVGRRMFEGLPSFLVVFGLACAAAGAVLWKVVAWLWSHISVAWLP